MFHHFQEIIMLFISFDSHTVAEATTSREGGDEQICSRFSAVVWL
ncbi:hypothetical protein XALC_2796 [Xanthomonas albilineans GPE PC73]|uniref:Uncharacterized protein n=1 Tax=Xanthomonas albilineans (strain GPE PC73 / CFBP 7063) TaxID=380358 RepID=D2UFW2_XANAP|nr:hypothetical protein XALC_2796 [Xanthomonas albilineans GPE PC73]